VAQKVRHVEIAKKDEFQNLFLKQIDFPSKEEFSSFSGLL
jgi:hypothetical protein